MAHGLDDRSEFEQIISKARHRWLRPAEICDILRNPTRLGLSDKRANLPASGSLFLYDRNVLRHFRNDGHRWKKTKNRRAVKEGHERLKVEGDEVLHCYYAHGEENENFQRRSYSTIEQDLSHIVLVHYREVKSNRTNFNDVEKIEEVVPHSNETEELAPNPEMQNSISSSFNPSNLQMHAQATDTTSLKTAQASEFKNAESGACWQTSEGTLSCSFNSPMDQSLHSNREYDITTSFHEEVDAADLFKSMGPCHMDSDIQNDYSTQTNNDTISKRNNTIEGKADHPSVLKPQSDNQQIFLQAKHDGWLRPAEIYEILQNYKKFHISSEPANMPPGGSLFLFNRKVQKHFRRDGHNWKKKKDGKTVAEGNEKLKVGGANVLHCYYTRGEENENFHRRSYQMLDKDLSHIALVHYREVKGNRKNFSHVKETVPYSNEAEEIARHPELDNSVSSSFNPSNYQMRSQATDATSLKTAQASEFKTGTQSDTMGNFSKQENETHGNLFTDSLDKRMVYGIENEPNVQQNWQTLEGSLNWLMDWSITTKLHEEVIATDSLKSLGPLLTDSDNQKDLQFQLSNTGTISKINDSIEGKADPPSAIKPLLDGSFSDGLKNPQFSSGAYWGTVESENEVDESSVPLQVRLDSYMLGPSLSHDQLFSIVDFSPNWAYENSEIKVLTTGKFLKGQHAESCKWSCMFGEVEVPAEVIADGVLRCYSPVHKAGRLPFYVTCSNRLACSEVREFEYRVAKTQDIDSKDYYSDCSNETLNMRFGKLLSLSSTSPNCDPISIAENSEVSSKISSLLKNDNDEWDKMLQLTSDEDFSFKRVEEQLLEQQLLKEKLHAWLLQKLAGGGKGPSVLDEGGQGVLHFGAALGYDWVLLPTITAAVSVNFRDVNGWTPLHWAAFCGRERMVASLISLGAAPGALTDPTTKYPTGETPADLASEQGHKGIAGYLAESALSAHLSSLNLDIKEGNSAEISGGKAVSASSRDGELTDGLSLRDSLTAVCNATQAAARIHQVFRVQSFQRKQMKEYNGDKFGISNERALSLIGVKAHKAGKRDQQVDAAAIRIQNKFRSWKGRKDYLIIRQRIVKIQAHVRGHQVRKNYRKIVWSVGIVEKIILRWRRKGSGLRGFKPEPLPEGPSMQISSSKDDDYDVLKEGRKQTEERLQKALARVKSMVQYPEARDQYHRLLNVVTEIQETKALNSSEGTSAYMDDELIDIEALLDEDIFMPTAAS